MKARVIYLSIVLALLATTAPAQWDIQDSHTTASLRGIDNVGKGVAWASGTDGTVLRTEDGGYVWQLCAIPPGAEKLDFRGIQASDANTAIVMSSGKGDLSRLYKTTDGCQTWKLIFTNPDKDGFFDSIRTTAPKTIYVLGDPVAGKFAMYFTDDSGSNWFTAADPGRDASAADGAFAASNSALLPIGPFLFFGTSASTNAPPHIYFTQAKCVAPPDHPKAFPTQCSIEWKRSEVPLASGSSRSGIFSLDGYMSPTKSGIPKITIVAIGGTYDKPEQASNIVASSDDGGRTWSASTTPPHGFRSAVAYDADQKLWITVGPNGTDISTDDGRNWRALKPSSTDPPDADKNWNALSLPYVVGPNGRIGKLRTISVNNPVVRK
ncbi:YCF48-related protein [Edaphobacter sp.]|uniref:YCF48-related protein n=1 Tax=Edaphobacter sp. TaxID=1934404 RepID=UPI002DB9D145|nr:YCF48-related protein [Edaphobacter sp.]HEU5339922.1 YCF48-related protein [Edaphobacter sp.]